MKAAPRTDRAKFYEILKLRYRTSKRIQKQKKLKILHRGQEFYLDEIKNLRQDFEKLKSKYEDEKFKFRWKFETMQIRIKSIIEIISKDKNKSSVLKRVLTELEIILQFPLIQSVVPDCPKCLKYE